MQDSDNKGVFLLFAAGKRPNRTAIIEFAEQQSAVSISHDPLNSQPLQLATVDGEDADPQNDTSTDQEKRIWVEILRNGLTFDLEGLKPGIACEFPTPDHIFDLARVPGRAQFEAVRLVPGQHLTGGEAAMPVVKGMVALARDLTHHFDDLAAVVWPPASSAIGRRYFESVITAWDEGGPFPALGLTAFRESVDGALQSVGLGYWIGQELRIEQPISADKVSATRLGARLINQLVLIGGLEESERVVAPDGMRLVMRPSANRKFIRVFHE